MTDKNQLDFPKVIREAAKFPGVRIDRKEFLRRELSKHFQSMDVEKALVYGPLQAGMDKETIMQISKSCINFETNKVTLISAATGLPGGLAMVGTIPADIVQYFAHILRVLQKLIYLYGWQELDLESSSLDDATQNQLTLFVGVMFGVNAANAAIGKLAQSAAIKTEKTLINKALTKGTIYPIVKKIASILGVKMNKEIFAKSVGKFIPGLGAVLSGGITYATYRPLANRLRDYLDSLPTVLEEDYIDVDFTEIIEEFNIE